MQVTKNSKPVLIILIALALLIWGNFIFKFSKQVFRKPDNKTHIQAEISTKAKKNICSFPFTGMFPDPFLSNETPVLSSTPPKAINTTQLAPYRVVNPPKNVNLIGIIGNTVVQKKNNEIVFTRTDTNQSSSPMNILDNNTVELKDSTRKDVYHINNASKINNKE